MEIFSRIKSAARILIKGEQQKKIRNPIPAITLFAGPALSNWRR
jgi:hypothetical protein